LGYIGVSTADSPDRERRAARTPLFETWIAVHTFAMAWGTHLCDGVASPHVFHPEQSGTGGRAGFGAVAAIQIDPQLLDGDPVLTDRVTLKARDHGVLTHTLTGGGLQISPPLVISRGQLDEITSGLAGALDDAAAAR
jgi:hypothetical protein